VVAVEEQRAIEIVERLRARNVFAHVHRNGVSQFGVRVVIPDGREALWDSDGAAGLEATIQRDGVLVGFVATIPGSESFDVDETVSAIAAAGYDSPEQGAVGDGSAEQLPGESARPETRTSAGLLQEPEQDRARRRPGLLGRLLGN
jgi:hypothetical protein